MKNKANAAHSSVPLREIEVSVHSLEWRRSLPTTGSSLSRNPKGYESAESVFLGRAPQDVLKSGRAASGGPVLFRQVHGGYAQAVNSGVGPQRAFMAEPVLLLPAFRESFLGRCAPWKPTLLRAGLVARAEEYRWSSAAAHQGDGRDEEAFVAQVEEHFNGNGGDGVSSRRPIPRQPRQFYGRGRSCLLDWSRN